MAITNPPKIGRLPEAPNRQTPRAEFAIKADAFVAAQDPWGQQVNTMADWMRNIGQYVLELAENVEDAEGDAAAQVALAVAQANRAESEANKSESEADRAEQYKADIQELIGAFTPAEDLPEGTVDQAPLVVDKSTNGVRFKDRALNEGVAVRPKLRFDFVNQKHLDPRITFTRASKDWDEYGNEYRIDEPVLTDKGLLVSPSRTNLLSNSNSTTYSNVTLEAVGTMGAVNILKTSSDRPAGSTWTVETVNVSEGKYVLQTCLRNERQGGIWLCLRSPMIAGNALFGLEIKEDLSYGLRGAVNITAHGKEDQGNGYTRFWFSFTIVEDTTVSYQIYHPSNNGESVPLYYYGMQLKEGTSPTSYIPTSGSQVTVSDSRWTVSLLLKERGSLIIRFTSYGNLDVNSWPGILALKEYKGGLWGDNTLFARYSNTYDNTINFGATTDGTGKFYNVSGLQEGKNTLGLTWEGDTLSASLNGSSVVESQYQELQNILQKIEYMVSSYFRPGAYLFYESIALFQTELTDTQLQDLTQ